VFQHVVAAAAAPDDELVLSVGALEQFCDAVGLAEAHRPRLASLNLNSSGMVSASEFVRVFADPTHAEAISRHLVETGVGGPLSLSGHAVVGQAAPPDANRQLAVDAQDANQVMDVVSQSAAVGGADAGNPPAPVVASPSYDAWCFGVMLYELATGRTLFRTDVREEVDDAELATVAEWSDAQKKLALARVADTPMRRLLDQLLQKDQALRLTCWDAVIAALLGTPQLLPGFTSRTKPEQEGKAWVCYGDFYFTANGNNESSHDEVYGQNPRLAEAVGTSDNPKAAIMDCTQGTVGEREHRIGGCTMQRQAKYGENKALLARRMAEELQTAEDLQASSRTVHRAGYRPDKGAWVQYGECCYTANGSNAWSHDVVYAQNELLEAAVGTKDEPTAEIMDVIQGSGKKQSGEATKLRQAKHEGSKALFAIQLIEDLRIQKLKASRARQVAAAAAKSETDAARADAADATLA
jgi:hypothetical protein